MCVSLINIKPSKLFASGYSFRNDVNLCCTPRILFDLDFFKICVYYSANCKKKKEHTV